MKDTAPKDFYARLRPTGIVSEFTIVGDSHSVLTAGVTLALECSSVFTHYRVVDNGQNGNVLHLLDCGSASSDTALPFPIRTAAAASLFIGSWIQEVGVYDSTTYCDGDGSNSYGFELSNVVNYADGGSRNMALTVKPVYVYYSK